MAPSDPESAPSPGPPTGVASQGDQPMTGGGDPGVAVADGVIGVVLDASGRPLAGVLVEAVAGPGGAPVPDLAVVTDATGRFVWPLRPGIYRLSARGATATVTVPAGRAVQIELIAR